MIKAISCLLCFSVIFVCSEARSRIQQPQTIRSLNITNSQNVRSCSFRVTIKTSCSSISYTRDQISLSFGDAYGNQVYAPRLDDVYSRTFERCSTDVFQITGPCTYQICYVYLYRAGSDGWKPETVRIDGYYTKSITFNYNTFIPRGVWFGFNFCQSFSQPSTSSV